MKHKLLRYYNSSVLTLTLITVLLIFRHLSDLDKILSSRTDILGNSVNNISTSDATAKMSAQIVELSSKIDQIDKRLSDPSVMVASTSAFSKLPGTNLSQILGYVTVASTASNLNLYLTGDITSHSIGSVKKGGVYPYFKTEPNWYQVETPDGIGWISGSSVKEVDNLSP